MANGLRGGYYLNFERERGIFTPRDRRFLAGMLDEELTDTRHEPGGRRIDRSVFWDTFEIGFFAEERQQG